MTLDEARSVLDNRGWYSAEMVLWAMSIVDNAERQGFGR